ncbi:MAG: hypothetical protein JW804_01430 [Sedimentisphaerales bacterium]|nr:hypothetical protein [Sedimentisphaerales bacterium]
MNKMQLIMMWLGILLSSLVWLDGNKQEQKMFIPIIIVATVGLIISSSNKSRKEQIIEKIRKETRDNEVV